jgi:hypothetical protein
LTEEKLPDLQAKFSKAEPPLFAQSCDANKPNTGSHEVSTQERAREARTGERSGGSAWFAEFGTTSLPKLIYLAHF